MSDELPVRTVLQVHTRYRQAGGEDQVVEAERHLLEAAGISVYQVLFDNANLRESRSLAGDFGLAASAIWSRQAHRRVQDAIAAYRPDVMHVHNTFAAASPSIYAAAGVVPVVQTLHNYRIFCPVATAFRDGHACTDCLGRFVAWPSVVHSCVHGSRSQSAVAAATLVVQRAMGASQPRVAGYLALSSFQRDLMIKGGLPAERIRVIPNFLEADPGIGDGPRSGVLYGGRLAEEKGVRILLQAAAVRPGLVRIVGDGPLRSLVEGAAKAGTVEYLGPLDRQSVFAEMRRAIAMVLPSIWFEGSPLAVLEAYATATPVIASRIGSLPELIDDGATGMLATPHSADDLGTQLQWAKSHPQEMLEMGRRARSRYEAQFRGATHLAALLDAYTVVTNVGVANSSG